MCSGTKPVHARLLYWVLPSEEGNTVTTLSLIAERANCTVKRIRPMAEIEAALDFMRQHGGPGGLYDLSIARMAARTGKPERSYRLAADPACVDPKQAIVDAD